MLSCYTTGSFVLVKNGLKNKNNKNPNKNPEKSIKTSVMLALRPIVKKFNCKSSEIIAVKSPAVRVNSAKKSLFLLNGEIITIL